MNSRKIVIMGVSGSGKSLIGERLANALEIPFFDADDFHSRANVDKMANGIPLDDEDRTSWLETLTEKIQNEPSLVLACSALKRRYRDQLRKGDERLLFLYLRGDFETILSRLNQRGNHYFQGESMLRSQFEQLEEPSENESYSFDIRQSPGTIVAKCMALLG